eukprot:TRINITY_DN26995_c0_g1_i1.p1 TRINITY_DN26995_c0_g1~~TRINITY_DN26995_c0_g1_i1.p1  ORF type:complete len:1335 (+),score=331.66 TRINITY_DN26995_c0_g1_i1:74-4078(+)
MDSQRRPWEAEAEEEVGAMATTAVAPALDDDEVDYDPADCERPYRDHDQGYADYSAQAYSDQDYNRQEADHGYEGYDSHHASSEAYSSHGHHAPPDDYSSQQAAAEAWESPEGWENSAHYADSVHEAPEVQVAGPPQAHGRPGHVVLPAQRPQQAPPPPPVLQQQAHQQFQPQQPQQQPQPQHQHEVPEGPHVGFLVPNDRASRVVGKSGAGLKQMREACGVKIVAKPEAEPGAGPAPEFCRLVMTGTVEQICIAFAISVGRAYPNDPAALVYVRIPDEWVGKVIGKGGANIKQAQQFKVNVQLGKEKVFHPGTRIPERLVTMEGPPAMMGQVLQVLIGKIETIGGGQANGAAGGSQVASAPLSQSQFVPAQPLQLQQPQQQQFVGRSGGVAGAQPGSQPMLSDPQQVTVCMMIEDKLSGIIIGRGGSRIKEFRQQTGAAITMTDRVPGQERRMSISGSLEAVAHAQQVVLVALAEARQLEGRAQQPTYICMFLVRKEAAGSVIGKQGVHIKEIRERAGCSVRLENEDVHIEGHRVCTLDGQLAHVLEAQRLLHERVRNIPMQLTVPGQGITLPGQQAKGPVVGMHSVGGAGHGNAAKRPLNDGHGAHGEYLDPSDPRTHEQYEHYNEPPFKRARQDEGMDDETTVLVPEQTCGLVIGKQGLTLKSIRDAFDVKMEVKRPDEAPQWVGDRMVIVGGMTMARAVAVEDVVRRSTQQAAQRGEHVVCKLLVPSSKVRNVTGEDGSGLSTLQEHFGVQPSIGEEIIVGDHMMMLQGNPEGVWEAAKQVVIMADLGDLRSDVEAVVGSRSAVAGAEDASEAPVPQPQAVMLDADDVTVHFNVPDSLAGVILGKGGCKIKEIQQLTGCKMKMADRVRGAVERKVYVSGAIDCVLNAQDHVQQLLRETRAASGEIHQDQYTALMLIRKEACGTMIGKQGATINSLREQSGATIKLEETEFEGQRICNMDGPFSSVLRAMQLIHESIKSVPVQPTLVMQGAGPGGSDVVMSMPPEAMEELETKLLIPEESCGYVIGKQGGTLKAIREDTGVKLEVLKQEQAPHWAGERIVVVKGATQQRAAAAAQVFQYALKHDLQADEGDVSAKLLLPAAKASLVSGKDNRNLHMLRDNLTVHSVLGTDDILGDRLMMIHGPPPGVLEAAVQVVRLSDGGDMDISAEAMDAVVALRQTQQPEPPQEPQHPQHHQHAQHPHYSQHHQPHPQHPQHHHGQPVYHAAHGHPQQQHPAAAYGHPPPPQAQYPQHYQQHHYAQPQYAHATQPAYGHAVGYQQHGYAQAAHGQPQYAPQQYPQAQAHHVPPVAQPGQHYAVPPRVGAQPGYAYGSQ